jgi:hypothetical protein
VITSTLQPLCVKRTLLILVQHIPTRSETQMLSFNCAINYTWRGSSEFKALAISNRFRKSSILG